MINTCPTVRIKSKDHERGLIINKSDFNSRIMKIWVDPMKVDRSAPAKKRAGKVSER